MQSWVPGENEEVWPLSYYVYEDDPTKGQSFIREHARTAIMVQGGRAPGYRIIAGGGRMKIGRLPMPRRQLRVRPT